MGTHESNVDNPEIVVDLHDESVFVAANIENGQALNRIGCWEIMTGQKAESVAGHQEFVNALAVSPDGEKLLSGSKDGTMLVWDLP